MLLLVILSVAVVAAAVLGAVAWVIATTVPAKQRNARIVEWTKSELPALPPKFDPQFPTAPINAPNSKARAHGNPYFDDEWGRWVGASTGLDRYRHALQVIKDCI